ncbi:MAG: hypothetical protein DRQ88_12065 [Epsilonproteobacteria bacterium]|nr:MAG: hypothetical protein DRQ89_13440 [Campylobacterota bacterium]RLA63739.1 MAG: hypothetical protein DRQ88_12065 [Campylobacterota bacterium]
MNKKFQLFISSTYLDLKEERSKILHSVLSHGSFIPMGMELFPATDDKPWDHIESVISSSDFYLLVVGGRYGSLTEEGLSYTEKEYQFAKSLGIPIMALIRGQIEKLPVEKKDTIEEKMQLLNGFKEVLQNSHQCKFWNSDTELINEVLLGINHFSKSELAVGWVRANELLTPSEALKIKNENEELKRKIESLSKTPVFSVKGIASGDQLTSIHYSYLHPTRGILTSKRDASWDEIISFLGPKLFAGKYDLQFKNLVEKLLFHLGRSKSFKIYELDRSTDKIKMQMLSLGLISEVGKVPLKGGGFSPLWELTPYGKNYVAKLTAEKSNDTVLNKIDIHP